MDITLYLPDGFYSKGVIFSPPAGLAHLIEPLRSLCPFGDERYMGVAVVGGTHIPVVAGQNEHLASAGAPRAPEVAPAHAGHGNLELRVLHLERAVAELGSLLQPKEPAPVPASVAEQGMSIADLRARAKSLGLSGGGTKEELLARIHDARGDA